jgi:hypothetical protein
MKGSLRNKRRFKGHNFKLISNWVSNEELVVMNHFITSSHLEVYIKFNFSTGCSVVNYIILSSHLKICNKSKQIEYNLHVC